ncbi:hypothetical protein B0H14DRAFT_2765000, partial [Mycena olivaceomarginata]
MPMCFVVQLELGFVMGIAAAGVYEPIVRPLHILIPALPIATYPPETWANLGYVYLRYISQPCCSLRFWPLRWRL